MRDRNNNLSHYIYSLRTYSKGGNYIKYYNVAIVGGGVAGAIAGIAAAREGVKTLVIESFGFLGGTLTDAGVGTMMTFHAGEK